MLLSFYENLIVFDSLSSVELSSSFIYKLLNVIKITSPSSCDNSFVCVSSKIDIDKFSEG